MEFNLSDKIINDSPHEAIYTDDVKEFIKQLEFWGHIDLGKQTLTIDYDKFKELVGKELTDGI